MSALGSYEKRVYFCEALLLLSDLAESRLATTSDQPTLSASSSCSPCCFVVASGVLPLEVDLRPHLGLLLDLDPKRRSPQAPSLDLDLDLDVG
ncbi:hypothetical protein MRX96_040844 [Rhipicephalus microplus]